MEVGNFFTLFQLIALLGFAVHGSVVDFVRENAELNALEEENKASPKGTDTGAGSRQPINNNDYQYEEGDLPRNIIEEVHAIDQDSGEPDDPKRSKRSHETMLDRRYLFEDEMAMDSLSSLNAGDVPMRFGFSKSEDGIVIPDETRVFYDDDDGEVKGRAKRDVTQAQRDILVKIVNDLRRTVNSSDMQYVYWNSADESLLDTWTSQCSYSAKVYVTATALILKMVTDQTPDFAAQLQSSFVFPDIQKSLTSVYFVKISASVSFCPQLVTNSTTTFNNSYLAVVSLTYVSGFKKNTTQYTVGPPCTACLSGIYWCDAGLCRVDCSPAIDTCYCRPDCLNCAGYNETTCKCKCLDGWGGNRCEYNTTATPTFPNCTTMGPSTYPATYSQVSTTTPLPITSTYSSSTSTPLESTTESTTETTSTIAMIATNGTTNNDNNTTISVQETTEASRETTPAFYTTVDLTTRNVTSEFPLPSNATTNSTTLTTVSALNNTSTTSSSTFQSTVYNNPSINDMFNYTQRLLDIENLLLRFLLLFQYYAIPTTTTSNGISPAADSALTSSEPNISGSTSSPGNIAASFSSSTPVGQDSSSNNTAGPTPTQNPAVASTGTTTSQYVNPIDLLNYLNSLEQIKNMILQILMTLEMRATQSTASSQSSATTNPTNASMPTPSMNTTSTAALNQTRNSTMPSFPNVSATAVSDTPNLSNGTQPTTGPTPVVTATPNTDQLFLIWQSLLEILRRLEMDLHTSATSDLNFASTNPLTPLQANSSAAMPSNPANSSGTPLMPALGNSSLNSPTPATAESNSFPSANPTSASLFGNTSSEGASTAAATKPANTTLPVNHALTMNQIQQLVNDIVSLLDALLRKTTPEKDAPTTPQRSTDEANAVNASNFPTFTFNAPSNSSTSTTVPGNYSYVTDPIVANASANLPSSGNQTAWPTASDMTGFTAKPYTTNTTALVNPSNYDPLTAASQSTNQPGFREFIIRIWDYRSSEANGFAPGMLTILCHLVRTILQPS